MINALSSTSQQTYANASSMLTADQQTAAKDVLSTFSSANLTNEDAADLVNQVAQAGATAGKGLSDGLRAPAETGTGTGTAATQVSTAQVDVPSAEVVNRVVQSFAASSTASGRFNSLDGVESRGSLLDMRV